MTAPEPSLPQTKQFDWPTARAIGDQVKLILAAKLPGCVALQYDIPDPRDPWQVEACFASRGPIVPMLCLSYIGSYSGTGLYLHYHTMFRNALDLHTTIIGHKIPCGAWLDAGPQDIAQTLLQGIAEVDLPEMIAAGSIERILAEQPRYPVPWPNLYLAQCATYLEQYGEARTLAENALQYAREDGRAGYANLIAEAETILSKLHSDPEALRKELVDTAEYNWSHFKMVVRQ